MTADEAMGIAREAAGNYRSDWMGPRDDGWKWAEPICAGREWVWPRLWYRWVVTVPPPPENAPFPILSVFVNDRTGAVEEVRTTLHVYNWIYFETLAPHQPPPLWVQFALTPFRPIGWSLDLLSYVVSLPIDLVHWAFRRRPARCPECGDHLPTSKAQQCFHCGADWHGSAMRTEGDDT